MQLIGAKWSGMSLLVKIISESEAGGRAGGAGWGRGASENEASDFFEAFVWRDIGTYRACLARVSCSYCQARGKFRSFCV